MDLATIAQIALSVLPLLVGLLMKAGAIRSVRRHLSTHFWVRKLKKAGASRREIREVIKSAALADLTN